MCATELQPERAASASNALSLRQILVSRMILRIAFLILKTQRFMTKPESTKSRAAESTFQKRRPWGKLLS